MSPLRLFTIHARRVLPLLALGLVTVIGSQFAWAQNTSECERVTGATVEQTFGSQAEAEEWIQDNGEKFASDLCRAAKCPDSKCALVGLSFLSSQTTSGRFEVLVRTTCRCLKGEDESCQKIEMLGKVELAAFHAQCGPAQELVEGLAELTAKRVCSHGFCKEGGECLPSFKIKRKDIKCVTNFAGCVCSYTLSGDQIKCKCAK